MHKREQVDIEEYSWILSFHSRPWMQHCSWPLILSQTRLSEISYSYIWLVSFSTRKASGKIYFVYLVNDQLTALTALTPSNSSGKKERKKNAIKLRVSPTSPSNVIRGKGSLRLITRVKKSKAGKKLWYKINNCNIIKACYRIGFICLAFETSWPKNNNTWICFTVLVLLCQSQWAVWGLIHLVRINLGECISI